MIRTLILALLVLATPPAPQIRRTPKPVRSVTVSIDAATGWQDSGVDLVTDQSYFVTASGSWGSGAGEPVGPDGRGRGTLADDALVGMVSRLKPARLGYESYTREIVPNVILIKSGGRFRSPSPGTLWLAMGDWSGCRECSGRIEVQIVIYD